MKKIRKIRILDLCPWAYV